MNSRFADENMSEFSLRKRSSAILQYSDRKSTRLNSSHSQISYAVFCLKKKKKNNPVRVTAERENCSHDVACRCGFTSDVIDTSMHVRSAEDPEQPAGERLSGCMRYRSA